MKRKSAIVLLWAFAWDVPAFGADATLKVPAKAASSAVFDWTGFYLGGHVGYGGGSFGPGTNPLPEQGVFFPHSITGLVGGYQASYNRQLPNNVVLGVETDVSFGSPHDVPRLVPALFHTTFDYFATARGRVGYAFGSLLPYVTGGVAWGQTHVNLNDVDRNVLSKRALAHIGWTAGLGVEFAVGGNWTAKAEYDYIDLARRTYDLTDLGLPRVNVDPNIHLFKVGLNYRLW
jgi:high affinity Mn2+ porin